MAALNDDVRALTVEEIDMVSGGDLDREEVLAFLKKIVDAFFDLLKDAGDSSAPPAPTPPAQPTQPTPTPTA